MADKERTSASEQLIEEGRRAKAEHAKRHGDDSPTSAAATAEECAELGRALGFGTYAADERAAEAKQVAAPPENKAQKVAETKGKE